MSDPTFAQFLVVVAKILLWIIGGGTVMMGLIWAASRVQEWGWRHGRADTQISRSKMAAS